MAKPPGRSRFCGLVGTPRAATAPSAYNRDQASYLTDTPYASPPNSFRSLRKAIGRYNAFVIIGGTITILGVLGFLIFLWVGQGIDEGKNAVSTWRLIILRGWTTQAITLSSLLLQLATSAQATVCTGLVAALVLERHGVRLSRLAEYSLIRSSSDGPLKLSWMLASSARLSVLWPTIMALVLLAGTVAMQFASTILVSDLSSATIVGDAKNESRGVSASFQTYNQIHLVQPYVLVPSFVPFGEVSGSDPSPSASGVSDTGIVKRAFPFIPQPNRTSLRDYAGRSFVFNSRVVCVPPQIDGLVLRRMSVDDPSFQNLNFVPYLTGNISYGRMFEAAGMEFPDGCSDGECFPVPFNCFAGLAQGYPDRTAIFGCIPDGRNAVLPSWNSTITNTPIANTSEVFLFTQSNIMRNATFGNATGLVAQNTTTLDEWTTYDFGGGMVIDMSICFQQVHFDRAIVTMSRDHDVDDPTVKWNANTTTWETSDIQTLFGLSNSTTVPDRDQQESFTVQEISNATRSSTTQTLTQVLNTDSYGSYNYGNVSIMLSPYGGGEGSIIPHTSYQALFADVLKETNRPALAHQSMITAFSGSIINGLLPQLDMMENITTVSSVSVQAPRRYLGLGFVLGIGLVNLVNVILIVSLYLVQTEYTSAGNYWHAIAQVLSDITQPILYRATQATDDEVTKMLQDFDVDVKLERSRDPSGRVQVVPCEQAGLKV